MFRDIWARVMNAAKRASPSSAQLLVFEREEQKSRPRGPKTSPNKRAAAAQEPSTSATSPPSTPSQHALSLTETPPQSKALNGHSKGNSRSQSPSHYNGEEKSNRYRQRGKHLNGLASIINDEELFEALSNKLNARQSVQSTRARLMSERQRRHRSSSYDNAASLKRHHTSPRMGGFDFDSIEALKQSLKAHAAVLHADEDSNGEESSRWRTRHRPPPPRRFAAGQLSELLEGELV